MAKLKPVEAWGLWLASLSGAAQQALSRAGTAPPHAGEETLRYHGWRGGLTDGTREVVDSLVEAAAVLDVADQTALRFLAVECPDGEWPVLRAFQDANGLTRRMQQLEGEDMTFFAFYGVHLAFTSGLPRYLFLPDGETVITVPVVSAMVSQRIEVGLLSAIEIQDDNYLGPKTLIDSELAPPKQKLQKRRARPSRDVTEDDDDDDEIGSPVD